MLQAGDPAADFELPNADLEMTSSSDFRARSHLVIYFYPKDPVAKVLKLVQNL